MRRDPSDEGVPCVIGGTSSIASLIIWDWIVAYNDLVYGNCN